MYESAGLLISRIGLTATTGGCHHTGAHTDVIFDTFTGEVRDAKGKCIRERRNGVVFGMHFIV